MTVHLVGAGPGDPDLLTLRTARLLERADAVVHDRLVGRGVLDLVSPTAEIVDVGKTPGGSHWTQGDINGQLISLAKRHDTVVRLKGGDPYVFGRGSEEAFALMNAGHRVEVVPGISSALAAPAAAGVPLTHRRLATGFTVVTASTAEQSAEVDWLTLGQLDHTIVVLMGARAAPRIAAALIEAGRSPREPVAVVGSATTADQSVLHTTLAELHQADIASPATIVIGKVAGFEGLPQWSSRSASHHHSPTLTGDLL